MASAAHSRPDGARPPATKPVLHYRRRSLWVSALYLPLLVIPWVITCVMMFKPVGISSYGDHVGTDAFTDDDAQAIGQWLTAAEVMSTIATVLALPVISALLAQAAVRYSQRQRQSQNLSLAQLFPLANRGWADLDVLFGTMDDGRTASPLLLLGALLVVIVLIQPPIQSFLVRYETTSIATCQDVPWDSSDARGIPELGSCRQGPLVERQSQRWFDPEPGDLEQCPQGLVLSKLINKLNDISIYDAQDHLWPEAVLGGGYRPSGWDISNYSHDYTTFGFLLERLRSPFPFYASSLPSEATTGVLRYHAMRQHSNSRCDSVSQSSFPSTCAGSSPFTTTFSHDNIVVKVCVPGSSNQAPWTRTRDRQTIDEELWIDFQLNPPVPYYVGGNSFTTHCTSNSTRGYFELGNQYNGNVPGPLLDKWPRQEEIVADFNDVLSWWGVYSERVPSEIAPARPDDSLTILWQWPNLAWDTPRSEAFPTPGPLMTSALALFGNSSFFSTAANAAATNSTEVLRSICRSGAVPLAMFLEDENYFVSACYKVDQLDDAETVGRMLLYLISGFVSLFSDTNMTQTMLDVSTFAANEILLTTTADMGSTLFSRSIVSSNGYEIVRPVRSISAIAVISTLLFLQVIAVVGLVVYNSSFPTWTASLDGLAMAKIGMELKELGLAPLGLQDRGEGAKLAGASGLVGLVDKEVDKELGSEITPVLDLGASGVITRAAGSDKVTKDKV